MTISQALAGRATSTPSGPSAHEAPVIEATLRCIARWGVAKTTLDDIAAEAAISRATIYRTFPGGKDVILTAVLQHEVRRFFTDTSASLEAADTLADLLTGGIMAVHQFVRAHDALGYLFEHEADLVLSHLAMSRLGPVVAVAAAFATPQLARFIDPADATAHAEWVVRNVLSYTLNPSSTFDLDRFDDVARLVSTYFLPVLAPIHP